MPRNHMRNKGVFIFSKTLWMKRTVNRGFRSTKIFNLLDGFIKDKGLELECQNKVEETGSEPNPLNQLLEELDELCIASADACEIKDQISMTKRLYLETEAL
ncbi:hypothetical protein T02_12193 [Trichinella nativa]|uniref:Uncharacterized protein n=1 Tax=Trichinella nativa TaxID=6335 RepID=A0A0V1LQW0_9BILA|nr:hypothetical protein T02_12193 [Trichinella nativa]